MAATKEPRTRAGILAAGLVKIVATPAELTERDAWWKDARGNRHPFGRDVARAEKHTPRTDWLKPPKRITFESLPGGRAPKWMNGFADHPAATRRHPDGYHITEKAADPSKATDWQKPVTPYPDMTPAQRHAELGRQLTRLKGEDVAADMVAGDD
jgi:hypothetical protein